MGTIKSLMSGGLLIMKSSRIAVYSGTFDPVSLGHLDLVLRGRCLFDHLVIGVGENPEKDPLFTVQERVALVTQLVSEYEDISVKSFSWVNREFFKGSGRNYSASRSTIPE